MPATGDGGRNCPGERGRRVQASASDCGRSRPVTSVDVATLFCGEHGELSLREWFFVAKFLPPPSGQSDHGFRGGRIHQRLAPTFPSWRVVARYGLRGQRLGEASSPGPQRHRRRYPRVPDSDGDDDHETHVDSGASSFRSRSPHAVLSTRFDSDAEPLSRLNQRRNQRCRRCCSQSGQGGQGGRFAQEISPTHDLRFIG